MPSPAENRREDPQQLIEDLGAVVGSEYHAAEAVMIGAVAAALRSAGPNDPATARSLARQGERIAAGIDARALATAVVHTATMHGVKDATADAGAPTTRLNVSMRVLVETDTLAQELGDSLAGLQDPIGRWMPTAYRTASGILSTQENAEGIASRYLARGVTGKVYANGAFMPIGSYAEMVARTITHQAGIVASTLTQQQYGLSLCSIEAAADACASCAMNVGKVWSLDGTAAGTYTFPSLRDGSPVTVEVAGPLAAASIGHFRGPNCRCQVAAYHPGFGIPRGNPHDPVAEAQRDRQRALERGIRHWKAREAASLTDADRLYARRHVRAAQKRMRQFISETGRTRRGYREQLTWTTGPRVATPAPAAVL